MAGLLSKIGGWLGDDTNRLKLAGASHIFGALDQGQAPNVAPFLGAIQEQQDAQAFRDSLGSDDMMGRFSPEERSFLAGLPPQVAQKFIAERIFAQPEPTTYGWQTMPDGTLVRTDSTGGFTPMGSFGKPAESYRTISGAEAAALGLDPAQAYNIGPDNKISQIGGGGVTVNNQMGGSKFDEAFAKGDADAASVISEAGMAAQRNIPRIDQLDHLLQSSPSGMGAVLAQRAGEWGIKTEGLDNIQAAQAVISSLVPEQRQPGSGPMSDADLALFKQSLPRLINTPGGNQIIIGAMRGIAQYDAEGAAIVQRMRSGELSRAEGFAALQARHNPLSDFKAPAVPSANAPATAVPQGVDPTDWEYMTPEERALFQ